MWPLLNKIEPELANNHVHFVLPSSLSQGLPFLFYKIKQCFQCMKMKLGSNWQG